MMTKWGISSIVIHGSYTHDRKKKFHEYVKLFRSDRCGVDTLLKDGTYLTDNQAKADLLNLQFSSVFTVDDGLPVLGSNLYPNIPSIEVSVSGIANLLSELDPSKSQGQLETSL